MTTTVRRLGAVLLAGLTASLLAITGLAPAAQAADLEGLSIKVTTATGAALAGATVTVIPVGNGLELTGSVATVESPAKSGRYVAVGGVEAGAEYTVQVTTAPTSGSNGYTQYLGGSATLDTARLYVPGEGDNTLDFSLQSGSLGGKTLTSAGTALKGIKVLLYRFAGDRWNHLETVTSASTGAFAFAYLEPGSYTLVYDSTQQAKYASITAGGRPALDSTDAPAPDAAVTSYYVTAGKLTTISQKIPTGGSISGTVRGGSTKLAGVGVRALLLSGSAGSGFTGASLVKTAATSTSSGAFTISGLAAGTYALSFNPTATQDASWVDPYVDPTLGVGTVRYVTVVAGKTTAAPTTVTTLLPIAGATRATLTGHLEGSPTTASGTVSFFSLDPVPTGVASISATGAFSIALVAGRYRYEVRPFNAGVAYRPTYGVIDATAGQVSALAPVAFEPETPMAFVSGPTILTASNRSGDVFTVEAETNHPTTTRLTYQWLRSSVPIFGARSASFQTGAADVGAQLSVRVGVVDLDGGENIAETVDTGSLVGLGSAPALLATPVIAPSTNVTVGSVVRVAPLATSPATTNFAYQWLNEGFEIGGATSSSYTATAADTVLSVKVTPVLAGREDGESDYSGEVAVAKRAAPVVKVAPKLTSKAVTGGITRYTVTKGTWTPTAAQSVAWKVDGITMSDDTTFDYDPAGPFAGAAVTVEVRASIAGYLDGVRVLVARKGTAVPVQSSVPTIIDTTTGAEIDDATDAVTVGDVLTTSPGTWTPVNPSDAPVITFRWERVSDSRVVGTGTSYTVTAADAGSELRLVSVATTRGYPVASAQRTAGLGTALAGLEVAPPTVVISNPAAVGDSVTAVRQGSWALAGVTDTVQWMTCSTSCETPPLNYTAIPGATKAAYTLPESQLGARLIARLTGVKAGYAPVAVYTVPTSVATKAATLITLVANDTRHHLEGLEKTDPAVVGRLLRVVPGQYVVASITRAYEWQTKNAAGGWVTVGTGTTYRPVASDFLSAAPRIKVVETVSKAGYNSQSYQVADNVDGYALVAGTPFESTTPKFTKSGSKVTMTGGAWFPAGVAHFEWLADGVPFGADATSATIPSSRAGATIRLHVTGSSSLPAYAAGPLDVTYLAVPGTIPNFAAGAITGTAAVGSTLTAPTATTGVVGESVDFAYQWYSGTTAIAGATSSTLVPGATLRGKAVAVRITAKATSYAAKSITTAARTIGYGIDPGGTVAVTTPGAFTPGAVLTAGVSGYTSGFSFSYAWKKNGVAIAKATRSSYALTAADAGASISVSVTITRSGFASVTRSSAGILVGTSGQLAATSLPTYAGVVDGTVRARTTITVTPPTFPVTAAVAYAWLRDGAVIRGASGPTFVTSPSDAGTAISAIVTARATGFDAATIAIAPVAVIDGAAATATTRPAVTGKAALCSTLTASTGSWNVDGLTFSYQWMTGSTPIAGATSRTFVPSGPGLAGTRLSVVVTATRAGIAPGTSSSVATAALASSGC